MQQPQWRYTKIFVPQKWLNVLGVRSKKVFFTIPPKKFFKSQIVFIVIL
ncbi:hypothetical protein Cabys_2309 [Caldithrix abyssi DSM 13497]|uniref:Uncharacterized protein n=1 Tax=Caldithrix abyssi DSM 13497 TaxID=880073 RepID=A0A1J1CAP1_CALAY|nr:hypothetical protein Cabys_2309 [Caldithrix abyssi DSM 13497]